MNSPIEPVELLDPSPQTILNFISRIVDNRWPDDTAQTDAYFASIDSEAGPAFEQVTGSPETTQGELSVPGLHTEHGSWNAVQGRLHGLNLFFYATAQGAPTHAGVAFTALRDHLTEFYGSPLDEATDHNGNQSALWHTSGTSIELYGYVTAAPMLQLGLQRIAPAT